MLTKRWILQEFFKQHNYNILYWRSKFIQQLYMIVELFYQASGHKSISTVIFANGYMWFK